MNTKTSITLILSALIAATTLASPPLGDPDVATSQSVVWTCWSGDQDDDGICDDVDNCVTTPNPDQLDTDEDGLGDACDDCIGSDGVDPGDDCGDCPDQDDDGLCDQDDNCPFDLNPGQGDRDRDGRGDACDVCPNDPDNDADEDGVCGDADNCADEPNPGQDDLDGDGEGDACDVCPNDPDNDVDADGFCAGDDNCPEDFNPGQADADDDGEGDACDETPTGGILPGEVYVLPLLPGAPCGQEPPVTFGAAPLFEWTSSALFFDLTVYPIEPGSSGDAALESRPVASFGPLTDASFVYPLSAEILEPGERYAYQVRAQDERGQIAAVSEVWCFRVAGVPLTDLEIEAGPEGIVGCPGEHVPLATFATSANGERRRVEPEYGVLPPGLGTVDSGTETFIAGSTIQAGLVTAIHDGLETHAVALIQTCDDGKGDDENRDDGNRDDGNRDDRNGDDGSEQDPDLDCVCTCTVNLTGPDKLQMSSDAKTYQAKVKVACNDVGTVSGTGFAGVYIPSQDVAWSVTLPAKLKASGHLSGRGPTADVFAPFLGLNERRSATVSVSVDLRTSCTNDNGETIVRHKQACSATRDIVLTSECRDLQTEIDLHAQMLQKKQAASAGLRVQLDDRRARLDAKRQESEAKEKELKQVENDLDQAEEELEEARNELRKALADWFPAQARVNALSAVIHHFEAVYAKLTQTERYYNALKDFNAGRISAKDFVEAVFGRGTYAKGMEDAARLRVTQHMTAEVIAPALHGLGEIVNAGIGGVQSILGARKIVEKGLGEWVKDYVKGKIKSELEDRLLFNQIKEIADSELPADLDDRSYREKKAALQRVIDVYKAQLLEAMDDLAEKEEALAQAQDELTEVQDQIEELEKDKNEHEEQLKELKQQLDALEAEISKLGRRFDEVKEEIEEIERKQQELQRQYERECD